MDKFSILGSDGSIDVAASANAYAKALSDWKAANEIASDRIETAIDAVFARFPGQRVPVPQLVSFSVSELGATPDQHKNLTARVHAYISGQTKAGKIFVVKGSNGGASRFAPLKKAAS